MAYHPFLAFSGNCREAFTRYKEVFRGDLALLANKDAPAGSAPPGANPNAIMHAAMTSSAGLLMGADDPSGNFDGQVRGMCVCCTLDDAAEAKRVFDGLAEGGQVQMPLGTTFFSPSFGMCTDRFGTPWMIMVEPQAES
jgi:PhnB protein